MIPNFGLWAQVLRIWRHPDILVLALIGGFILTASFTAADPLALEPAARLSPPGADFWLGSDHLGRDSLARLAAGGRLSLGIGLAVVGLAGMIGLLLGLGAGFFPLLNDPFMRLADGLLAFPPLLLAIALAAAAGNSPLVVVIAISLPESARIARLLRALLFDLRAEPFIAVARMNGLNSVQILKSHLLPNMLPPLAVQLVFAFATAVLTEALLGFLGLGVPPEVASWGNLLAQNRLYAPIAPWLVVAPAVMILLVVAAATRLADRLTRDFRHPAR